jgi:hypothetical protein
VAPVVVLAGDVRFATVTVLTFVLPQAHIPTTARTAPVLRIVFCIALLSRDKVILPGAVRRSSSRIALGHGSDGRRQVFGKFGEAIQSVDSVARFVRGRRDRAPAQPYPARMIALAYAIIARRPDSLGDTPVVGDQASSVASMPAHP